MRGEKKKKKKKKRGRNEFLADWKKCGREFEARNGV